MGITLLGTSHIAQESKEQIINLLNNGTFSVVAVELDKDRLYAMLDKKKPKYSFSLIKKIGLNGFLFGVIGGWLSRKLGKSVGVMPGEDMLTAVEEAQKRDIKVALIDQPILYTLHRFSKETSWRIYWQFIRDLFRSIFRKKKMMNELGLKNFDLHKVPSGKIVNMMIKYMEKSYPEVYSVLVEERNNYMANQLKALNHMFPDKNILAVVGAGHVPGMKKLLGIKQ